MNSIRALATDYDETIAHNGYVSAKVHAALARFRQSGRKLILNTGRELQDLLSVCPDMNVFDLAILENGAVMYRPSTQEEVLLGDPPPEELVSALRRRGVPILHGRVALESTVHYRRQIDDAILDSGIERSFAFNKSSIIILPPATDKATGLRAALAELEISIEDTAGIGDAENDHALLAACGLAVAVPHATDALKREAHQIMGPIELIDRVLAPASSPS
jgi:hydroxymethylpyrimidine pyrophosphatase-like HAD family hydrolase